MPRRVVLGLQPLTNNSLAASYLQLRRKPAKSKTVARDWNMPLHIHKTAETEDLLRTVCSQVTEIPRPRPPTQPRSENSLGLTIYILRLIRNVARKRGRLQKNVVA